MKPVAIFRHSATEGPGYFATVLDRHRIPWQVIKIDAGEAGPRLSSDLMRARIHGWTDERKR